MDKGDGLQNRYSWVRIPPPPVLFITPADSNPRGFGGEAPPSRRGDRRRRTRGAEPLWKSAEGGFGFKAEGRNPTAACSFFAVPIGDIVETEIMAATSART